MEIWKDIIGYEGLYQISNLGRVKSLEKKVNHSRSGFAIKKEKIIKHAKKENDYLFVSLSKDDSKKCNYVHRLVAIHFIPNPENKPEVNHKKSNKEDNRWFMLEWSTRGENLIHSFKEGTRKPLHGILNPKAKLNDEKVKQIKERYKEGGISIRSLANDFSVHRSIVDGILSGKRWAHVN